MKSTFLSRVIFSALFLISFLASSEGFSQFGRDGAFQPNKGKCYFFINDLIKHYLQFRDADNLVWDEKKFHEMGIHFVKASNGKGSVTTDANVVDGSGTLKVTIEFLDHTETVFSLSVNDHKCSLLEVKESTEKDTFRSESCEKARFECGSYSELFRNYPVKPSKAIRFTPDSSAGR